MSATSPTLSDVMTKLNAMSAALAQLQTTVNAIAAAQQAAVVIAPVSSLDLSQSSNSGLIPLT